MASEAGQVDAVGPRRPYGECLEVQLTLECPLHCRHCIVDAAPGGGCAPGWLADLLQALPACRSLRAVRITGGEPFSDLQVLGQVVARCRALGLVVHVVTSAFWATSPRVARDILDGLPGLTHLDVSTDVYHLEHVPLAHVRSAVSAGLEGGRFVVLRVCTGADEAIPAEVAAAFAGETHERFTVAAQPVFARGRASRLGLRADAVPWRELPLAACASCALPLVLCDGTVLACNNPVRRAPGDPLRLGAIGHTPLARMLAAADGNYLVHALRVWGPRGILELLGECEPLRALAGDFPRLDPCALCQALLGAPGIAAAVSDWLAQPEIRRALGLGRALQFGETAMLAGAP